MRCFGFEDSMRCQNIDGIRKCVLVMKVEIIKVGVEKECQYIRGLRVCDYGFLGLF